jgi:glycosyltransferase involved in cell wall biosynthesis
MNKKVAKTKVLYIITKSNWGGAQRYVFDMATSITKDGYEAIVATGGEGALKSKLENAGIRTISILNLERDINIFSEWKVFFNLLKVLKQERPDVVHLNSSKIGGLGAFACRIARVKKIIFTAHGWAYKEDRNIISKKIIWFFSLFTVLLSHKTIVVSEDDFDNAPKLFVRRKIAMVHNGISEIKFEDRTTTRKTLATRLNLNIGNTVWIGTISELHKNKGLTFVIRAINNLVKRGYNISFFVIGEGEERFPLEQFIKKLKLENNVFLLGHIDNAPELLKAFDIFTLTSLKEGLPYVLLEAGSAGLPIIATNIGGIPDIIENRKSGLLVRPKNSSDIESVVSDLIDFKKDGIQYGNILKEKIEREFTIEQMVAETVDIYD